MKRILTIFLAILLCFSIFPGAVSVGASPANAELSRFAAELLAVLSDSPLMTAEPDSSVTRGDFMAFLGEVMRFDTAAPNSALYTDVPLNHPAATAIYAARQMGWISAGTEFEPNRPIQWNEALKAVVGAGGYHAIAEESGGFPVGYRMVARRIDLLDGLKDGGENELTANEAVLLAYNLLNAGAMALSRVDNGMSYYNPNKETWLERLWQIERVEGIVTATRYNSLLPRTDIRNRDELEIEGVTYEAAEAPPELLGLHVLAFYREDSDDNGIIEVIIPTENSTLTIQMDDIDTVESNTLIYYGDNGKQRRARLDAACVAVYNGRVADAELGRLLTGDGSVKLVDNDGDGVYEFAFVERLRYILIETLNPATGQIGDANGSDNSLNLEDSNINVRLSDQDGTEITLYELAKGQILAVKESLDHILVDAVRCSQAVSGTVTRLNTEEQNIFIDGIEYRYSPYLMQYYKAGIHIGTVGQFLLGLNGTVVAFVSSAGGYQYGYLIQYVKTGSFSDEMLFKIFSQSGDMKIVSAANRVTVDGVSIRREDLEKVLSDFDVPGLTRYRLNSSGELSHFDLPGAAGTAAPTDNRDEDDSMLRYSFSAASFRYRSSSTSCTPYFNLSDTIIFKIPNDLTQDEYFVAGAASTVLSDDSSYSFEVYDLNEAGSAGAVVYTYDSANQSFGNGDASYIVESISQGLDEEGELVKCVDCWSNGRFYTLYLPDTVSVNKDSGTGLTPGDIFRAKLNGDNRIISICVDVDGSGENIAANSMSSASFNDGNVSITYQLGKAYKIFDRYLYLSAQQDIFGDYDYTLTGLRNYYFNTTNIVKFDRKRQKLLPITAAAIKSYVSHGNENDFLVVRQSRFSTSVIFVYE